MVKPWMMIVASALILIALRCYDMEKPIETEVLESAPEYFEGMNDWEYFKKTNFALYSRLDLNGKLTYQVGYFGSNIQSDLDTLGKVLTALHEGEIIILVQSPYNEELITYMYEKGEVVKIK